VSGDRSSRPISRRPISDSRQRGDLKVKTAITHVIVPLVVVAAAGAAVAAPLRSGASLTVVPPAFYAGTSRADTLNGTRANDVLRGRGGNDTLHGRGGNDLVDGGVGNDRTYGDPGRDTVLGGAGNDRLYSRDRQRDTLNGGPGFDEAWVDGLDVVRNVERVHRPE
jgi:Ca2+-binding RTX toxin-like protein